MENKDIEILSVNNQEIVSVDNDVIHIVNIGGQGPSGSQGEKGDTGEKGDKGDTGLQGPSGSITESTYNAYTTLLSHKIVFLNDSGELDYASNDNPSCIGRVVGITTNSAIIGDPVNVVTLGLITEPSWSFNVNLPIFIGLNGNITQVAPSSSGLFQQIIGFALSSNQIYVKIREPILI